MSILASPQIHKLIDLNIVTGLHENVNAASLDIRIGNKVLLEAIPQTDSDNDGIYNTPVDISLKQSPAFIEVEIPLEGLIIEPGQCFLAHSVEFFNLPNTISAQYVLRSSLGRCFLEHMNAGFCDAGWNGAQLTMEFKNMTKHHRLLIKPEMRVGQMVFFEHADAGADSYAIKGNYNNQTGATAAFTGEGHATA